MINKFFLKIILVFCLLFLAGCSEKKLRDFARHFPDRPDRYFQKEMAAAPPDFRQGWEDGCNVGMSGGSNVFYKMFYQNNAIDGYKAMESPVYNEAWNNAMWYCYRFDQIKNGADASPVWGSVFSGYK